jgi:hypothetical protein
MHPTAERLKRRLLARGLDMEVTTLADSARTAPEAAAAVDRSLQRFQTVWCAAGTPHAVFEVSTAALISALAGAEVIEVA